MIDLEFDDRFWRDALAALNDPEPESLSARRPEYARFVVDLADEARQGGSLVGVRVKTGGDNPRLFALLTAAHLARLGVPTLFVDPSPGVRWLERLTGLDLKQGLVDHLQYGVGLAACVRPTGIQDLRILGGGAPFMAGSAMEDAPAFRAVLQRLRQDHPAVVVVLPETAPADASGVPALCDALVTIEGSSEIAALVGSERAVVRLAGDPDAASELERLATRFLGSLAVFSGRDTASLPAAADVRSGPAEADAEAANVAFLRTLFEARERERAGRSPSAARSPGITGGTPPADVDAGSESAPPEPATVHAFDDPRSGPWRTALGVAVGIVLILLALGAVSGRLSWSDGRDDAPRLAIVEPEPVPLDPAEEPADVPPDAAEPSSAENGPVVSADSTAEIAGAIAPDESGAGAATEPDEPVEAPGEPVPWSVHVGSYQAEDSGGRLVGELAGAGYNAFLAPVSLPGKGRWQRVFVGSYPDSTAARTALERLLDSGLVEEGVIRATPYAFLLGAYPTRAEAERQRRSLARQGIPAYLAGDDPVRLYAGAYGSEEEALLLARSLDRARESAPLILRRQ